MVAREMTLKVRNASEDIEVIEVLETGHSNVIPFPGTAEVNPPRQRMTPAQRQAKLRRQRQEEQKRVRAMRQRQKAALVAIVVQLMQMFVAWVQALPRKTYKGLSTFLQCSIVLCLFLALAIFAYAFLFSAVGYCTHMFFGW